MEIRLSRAYIVLLVELETKYFLNFHSSVFIYKAFPEQVTKV